MSNFRLERNLPIDSDYISFLKQISRGHKLDDDLVSFFEDYSVFLQGGSLLSRMFSQTKPSISHSKSLDRKCLTIECVQVPALYSNVEDEGNCETFGGDYVLLLNCTGSVVSSKGEIFIASSQSYSYELTDEDFYDDLDSVLSLFHPELVIDIVADDYSNLLRKLDEPLKFRCSDKVNRRKY